MDVNLILKQLQSLEESLKCTVCSKKCVNPIKIKVCGHYFCLDCCKLKDLVCPKCKIFYSGYEVDYDNIAKQSETLLLDLKETLSSSDRNIVTKINSESYALKYKQQLVDIFLYNNKTYHINYIDVNNKVNAKGETPLHIACRRKQLESVNRLINNKTDLNVKDFAGWAPLHEAVQSGSIDIVQILLENGALVDIPGEEYITPLHKAVMLENLVIIKLLLQYNANKATIDYIGKKPIDYTQKDSIKSVFNENVDYIQKFQEVFCRKHINVYFYYIEEVYKEKLSKSKQVTIIKEYDAKKVTHFLIRKTHKPSLKLLIAMLNGCFLLPQEWIDDFLENNYFIPIANYIFISIPELNNGIRRAFINSVLKLPKLFDGMYFYICGHNHTVEVDNLKLTHDAISLLIISGGGKILHRAPTPLTCKDMFNYPYHSNVNDKISRCCHYLIYEECNPPPLQYHMAEIKHKSSKWLFDCVMSFTICD